MVQVYLAVARATLRARLMYRWNFVLDVAFQWVMLMAELFVVILVASAVHGVAGWSVPQLILLFGLGSLAAGTYRVFASELHAFDKYLVNGEFDAVLTRPAPSLIVVAARSVDVQQVGMLLQGLVIVAYAVWRLHLWPQDGFGIIGEITLAWLSGGAIWVGLVIVLATLGFWTTRIDDLAPVILYGPETATTFPLSIYPPSIKMIFYGILPIAFGGYVPARVILHKGLGPIWLLLSLGVAALTLVLSVVFWNIGVRRYTSTGS